MIWFDWFCRQASGTLPPRERSDDPRRNMALYVLQGGEALRHGAIPGAVRLEAAWYTALFPFVAPFLPTDSAAKFPRLGTMPKPLGLVLTRATANLLSDARSPAGGDIHWRNALGAQRAVYIDVPHGALLLAASPNGGDMLELRAIFVPPLAGQETSTPFIALLTDPGSERPRGRACAKIEPNGQVLAMRGADNSVTQADLTLKAPFFDSLLEVRIRERSAEFLRLVLAYYFFGPAEARVPIAATPTTRLRNGKPRKDESLFSMTQLQPARDRLGRSETSIPTSWTLTTRQEVAGHFRLQPYGPGWSLRRLIWVQPYERGPEDAPAKPQAIRL
jgi:hypothetical protein